MSPVRWGVLSTGNIAREMVEAGGAGLPFGAADAIDQAAALQALARSSEIAAPVVLS